MEKKDKLLIAEKIYTPFQELKNNAILIHKDKIKNVSSEYKFLKKASTQIFNFGRAIISPGFIDVHCHGGFGIDFAYAQEKEIEHLAKKFLSLGVTNLCPTIYALPPKKLFKQILKIKNYLNKPAGTIFNKIHLEGPYLNKEKCGAINKNYLREFKVQEIKNIFKNVKGENLIITIAPELKNNLKAIKYLTKNNCSISLGHSTANYPTTLLAYQNGAKAITHLFNAMPQLHHRNLSLTTFGLLEDKIYCEVIADMVHINKNILKLIFKSKDFKNIMLISDGMSAMGMGEGVFQLAGQKVMVKNDFACLQNGTLAGSIAPQITMIKKITQELNYCLEKILPFTSYYPAKYLNLKTSGEIKENKLANLTIFAKNFNIIATVVEGNIYFKL